MTRLRMTWPCAIGVACLSAQVVLAGFAATDVFVPSVGHGPGVAGSNWKTTMWVYNPGPTAADVQYLLLERISTNPSPLVYNETIPAGDTRRYTNAVEALFGVAKSGALRVTATARVVVNARVYSTPGGGEEKDTAGQFFAGVPASFAIGPGQSTSLLGVFQTVPTEASEYRYNFGIVETAGGLIWVRVTVRDGVGEVLRTKDLAGIGPYGTALFQLKNEFPDLETTNAQLSLEVLRGTGKMVAFGSGIANRSNDPSTFEMQFQDDLLAANTSTLKGVLAGQGLTGGGTEGTVTLDVGAGAGISVSADAISIADNGVTAAKLADGAVVSRALADHQVTGAKLAEGAVGTTALADHAVTSAKLADGAVTTSTLATSAVTKEKLSATGGTSGQILGTDGTALVWQDGGKGLTLPYAGSLSSLNATVFSVTQGLSGTALKAETVGYVEQAYAIHAIHAGGAPEMKVDAAAVYAESSVSPAVVGVSYDRNAMEAHSLAYKMPADGLYATSSSELGNGVVGWALSKVGATVGVWGGANSSLGKGVTGEATSPSGTTFGVWGSNAAPNGAGVYGVSNPSIGVWGQSTANHGVFGQSAAAVHAGVWGLTSSSAGWGVYGENTPHRTLGYLGGVYGAHGQSPHTDGRGVDGLATATTGTAIGVHGQSNATEGTGVVGLATHATGVTTGVWGEASSPANNTRGVIGWATARTGNVYGVQGRTDSTGGVGVHGLGGLVGVFGYTGQANGTGVMGQANNGTGAIGVHGLSTSGLAGQFDGDVRVNGMLTKSSGAFKIDHPLDPEGQYLYHSFVESPDMKNVYDGVSVLDEAGQAVVVLPDYFEALNRDFRYQLTCVGAFAPVYIAEKIRSGQFTIAGGTPGLEVSWQVTGIRKDAFAELHRIPVAEPKPELEQGTYLHPEAWGKPAELGALHALRPELTEPPRDFLEPRKK